MRFEIGPGGGLLILLAIAGLSGAVFMLGLVSGYQLGRVEEPPGGLASTYTVEPPPSASAGTSLAPGGEGLPPVPTAAPAVALRPSSASGPALGETGAPSRSPERATESASRPRGTISSPANSQRPQSARAALGPPPAAGEMSSASASGPRPSRAASAAPVAARAPQPERRAPATLRARAGAPSSVASRGAAPHPTHAEARRKPYTVWIGKRMDRAAAKQLYQRLVGLGFEAHLTPATVGSETWYRLSVGPYRTKAEAEAAERRLHEEYDRRFAAPAASD